MSGHTPTPWEVVSRNGDTLVYRVGADPMKVLSVAQVKTGTAGAGLRRIVEAAIAKATGE